MSGPRVFVVDNYDSFTYNLVDYIATAGAEVRVERNDAVAGDDFDRWGATHLVVSPGPGTPAEAGVSADLIGRATGRIPVLGVCLGHQAVGQVYGGNVVRAPEPMHGKTTLMYHQGQGVFQHLPIPFEANRYHSLIVERSTLPNELEITAETADGLIMGLRHRTYPVEGVQFHPESIMTPVGKDLLRNFLAYRNGHSH